jgi:preprotein translocase subunit Sec61beta
MADNKIRMPSSGGGLINYYDEFKSKLTFSPKVVLIIIIVVIIAGYYLYKTSL